MAPPTDRPETKGEVERPFSHIRQDFELGRSFRDLEDPDAQFADWLDTVANVRVHGTTGRAVDEALADGLPSLRPPPPPRRCGRPPKNPEVS